MMTLLIDLAPYGGGLIITIGAISAVLIQRNTADRRELRDRTIDRLEKALHALSKIKIWSRESLVEVGVFAKHNWPTGSDFSPVIPVDIEGRPAKSHELIIEQITLDSEFDYDALLNLIGSYYPEKISRAENNVGKAFNRYKMHATSTVSRILVNFNEQQVFEKLHEAHNSYQSLNKQCNDLTIEIRRRIEAVHKLKR